MSFFKYDPNAPVIELFGFVHIAALFVCAAVCALLTIYSRRAGARAARRLELIIIALIILSEAARESSLTLNHAYTVDQLPLHVCSLAVFCSIIYVMRRIKIAGELLYCLFMPGALFALAFPGWGGLPTRSFLSLNSFFVHTLLFSYPLTLLVRKELRPHAKRLPLCLVVIAVCAAPLYFLDRATGANFFFLSYAPKGSPLELFYRLWGSPGYIFGYFPLLAAVWAVLYTPLLIAGRRREK